jgi:hypothetical protein
LLGVVRGRTEVGPRALGHRSLLMSAEHADAKRRMNQARSCPLLTPRAARGLACLSATAERVCDSRPPILLYGAGEAPAVVPAGRTRRAARRAASPRRGRIACGAIPCCVGLPSRCAARRGSGRRIPVPCSPARLGSFVCLFVCLLSRERGLAGFAAAGPSPFMSFAPTLSAAAMARFPAAAHLDQSARIQASAQR